MVSKFGHCLNDLLFRHRIGALPIDVVGVVSNHRDYRGPGRRLRASPSTTSRSTARDQGRTQRPQLLRSGRRASASTSSCSPATCRCCRTSSASGPRGPGHQHPPLVPAELQGRQALPPGARARRQADRRHRSLRDHRPRRGPDHRAGGRPGRPQPVRPRSWSRAGRDVECQALARAVLWHAENRILLNGHRTVVFR